MSKRTIFTKWKPSYLTQQDLDKIPERLREVLFLPEGKRFEKLELSQLEFETYFNFLSEMQINESTAQNLQLSQSEFETYFTFLSQVRVDSIGQLVDGDWSASAASTFSAAARVWEPVNYAAWYTADDLTSLAVNADGTGGTPALGTTVGRWLDKGGSANADGRQATSASRPIRSTFNGRPSLSFSGSNFLECLNRDARRNVQYFCIFCVYAVNDNSTQSHVVWYASTTNSATTFGASTGARNAGSTYTAGGRRLDGNTFQSVEFGTVVYNDPTAQIADFRYQDATLDLYVKNSGVAPSATNSSFHTAGATPDADSLLVTIGGRDGWQMKGHIMELVIFKRRPTQTERESFMAHARDYWGVNL